MSLSIMTIKCTQLFMPCTTQSTCLAYSYTTRTCAIMHHESASQKWYPILTTRRQIQELTWPNSAQIACSLEYTDVIAEMYDSCGLYMF